MKEVLLTATARGFGAALVMEDNRLSGLITDGDLRRHMDSLLTQTAGGIATPNPTTITPEAFAAEALSILNQLKISVMPVVDKGHQLVGLLHMHDLLRAGIK